MAWSIAAAALGTGCRMKGERTVLPVAAYRINAEGETHVLVAPHNQEPKWVPLEDLDVLSRP